MDDVRTRLRQAGERVTLPDRPFERLVERRERSHRNERLASAALALMIAAGVAGGSLALLSGLARPPVGAGQGDVRSAPSAQNLALPAGQYFYLKIESSPGADGWARDEETWWAQDGSGEIRNLGTRQDKYPQLPSGAYGPAEFPSTVDISRLSTDPNELVTQLEGAFGHTLAGPTPGEPGPQRLWDLTGTLLLGSPDATPELRAALFQVAAAQDGVRTIGDAHDPAGRSSTALEFTNESERITWTMYFDPATRQLMAWTSVYDGNAPAWILLDSGIVDSPGVRPVGHGWLVPPT